MCLLAIDIRTLLPANSGPVRFLSNHRCYDVFLDLHRKYSHEQNLAAPIDCCSGAVRYALYHSCFNNNPRVVSNECHINFCALSQYDSYVSLAISYFWMLNILVFISKLCRGFSRPLHFIRYCCFLYPAKSMPIIGLVVQIKSSRFTP